jgi:hypothetical protein
MIKQSIHYADNCKHGKRVFGVPGIEYIVRIHSASTQRGSLGTNVIDNVFAAG